MKTMQRLLGLLSSLSLASATELPESADEETVENAIQSNIGKRDVHVERNSIEIFTESQGDIATIARLVAPLGWYIHVERRGKIRLLPNYTQQIKPPAKMYHATERSLIPTIMREGLKPMRSRDGLGFPPRVYLSKFKEGITTISAMQRGKHDIVLLEVDMTKLANDTVFYHDAEEAFVHSKYCASLWTYSIVPPEALRVVPLPDLPSE